MLRLFGHAASINVRKVLWTCEELGLAVEREDWGGAHRPTSAPEFRALNPVGLIPVIDDAGEVVWESNTIVRYLAASRGRDDLLPPDAAGRARVERWMDWQVSDFNNSWRYAFLALVRRRPDYQDAAQIERSLAACAQMVRIVDDVLRGTSGYIAGDAFTVADVVIGLSLHRWRSLPADRPEFPHVERYYRLLCERDGFRRFGRDGGP
ncbi:MAG: glutathione S-transferase [Proteobacteria bacterium]|nr:glutathione S-transferase [Pseudomonadota bacterium]